ncbi:hypothetical protein [Allosphingosinicella indica]|uniref:Uncharacterized protein n=1 Tax=Allosphingosinicella indica TaxID=941907 RepID=A0A1X7FZ05_9SPHN|nr:hypothetical protein [Allosphingosinicella indica]SMF61335.1 hypothetical protein SAMN06295910_0320 [Allosphingosinicella indica]
MRKVVLALVAASATFTAIPAAAQPWRPAPAVHRQIQNDINQLERRIDRSAQRGVISRREAVSLRRDALDLQRTYNRYARNGLDRSEVRDLEYRINRVHAKLRYERRDWDGRRG